MGYPVCVGHPFRHGSDLQMQARLTGSSFHILQSSVLIITMSLFQRWISQACEREMNYNRKNQPLGDLVLELLPTHKLTSLPLPLPPPCYLSLPTGKINIAA